MDVINRIYEKLKPNIPLNAIGILGIGLQDGGHPCLVYLDKNGKKKAIWKIKKRGYSNATNQE